MPVKRRRSKQRAQVAPDAWNLAFEAGHDFLGELDRLGLPDPLQHMPGSESRKAAQAAWHAATGAAWHIHGAAYLNTRHATQGVSQMPWALEEFGQLEGFSDAS